MAYRRKIPLRGPWALLVGVVCLGIGFYQFLTSNALAEHGVVTEATVLGVESRHGRKMRTRYALRVEFRDLQGTRHREQTGYQNAYGRYRRGDRIEIRYNPNRPSEFAIDSFKGLWYGPLLWGGIGLLACTAFLFGSKRHRA